jgi:hypothetical protein
MSIKPSETALYAVAPPTPTFKNAYRVQGWNCSNLSFPIAAIAAPSFRALSKPNRE